MRVQGGMGVGGGFSPNKKITPPSERQAYAEGQPQYPERYVLSLLFLDARCL